MKKKPSRWLRSPKIQKKRTETIKEMIEVATGIELKNLRGKHFKFERSELRKAILRIFRESPRDFYFDSGKFKITSLVYRVESYFEHGKIDRKDFYASNEKAIKEEIKNLINAGKIKRILESSAD